MQRLLTACAACCIVVLVVLSWIPGLYMVRTQVLSGPEEHFLAYALSGIIVAAARRSSGPFHVAAFLVLLAAVLELGQHFVPGRNPAIADFAASAFGAIAGVAITWLTAALL